MERYIAYTDGSCNNRSKIRCGGWGCLVFRWQDTPPKIEEAICTKSGGAIGVTNNIMEITAIIEAARSVPNGSKIYIKTDSQYCIAVLSRPFKPHPKNAELIRSFGELIREKALNIEFRWVRGHNGNIYNEECDRLAVSEYRKLSNLYERRDNT